jgi:hypothetical protein
LTVEERIAAIIERYNRLWVRAFARSKFGWSARLRLLAREGRELERATKGAA